MSWRKSVSTRDGRVRWIGPDSAQEISMLERCSRCGDYDEDLYSCDLDVWQGDLCQPCLAALELWNSFLAYYHPGLI
jgi:hypothetical protein